MKRACLAVLLLAWPPGAARARAQEAPRPSTEPPDARVELDYLRYYTDAQLQSALQALATAYPEFLRLESLGKSRGGRELWVMTVAARDGADPSRKPALLVVGARSADDLQGAEMALFTLLDLAQNHARDESVARTLAQTALYVVPCLDPDRRASVLEPPSDGPLSAPRAVDLDANFPAAWDPWTDDRSGPYPLSEPETRALVDFLSVHPNVALVQTYGGVAAKRAASPLPGLGPADLAVYASVVARADQDADEPDQLLPFSALAARGGSLLDQACLELGAYGFESTVRGASGEGLPRALELYALARRAKQHTLSLAGVLPRPRFGEAQIQRLKNDVWQVEVELHNDGLLPTMSELARRRRAAPPRLGVSGARLIAAALREDDQGPFVPQPRLQKGFSIPEIEGGGRLQLRLVVAGDPESALEIALSGPRSGSAQCSLVLR